VVDADRSGDRDAGSWYTGAEIPVVPGLSFSSHKGEARCIHGVERQKLTQYSQRPDQVLGQSGQYIGVSLGVRM
jgi:hypothetical protein